LGLRTIYPRAALPELQSHHSVKSWSKESRKSAIHDAYLNGTLSPGSDANNATTLPEGYTQHAKEVAERIKALDNSISRPAAERYPETIYLQQVSGVGPITSLYFVLKVGNPGRFQRTRHWSLPGLVSEAGLKRRD